MTSVSRAAQRPAPADDPGGVEPEDDGGPAPLFDDYLSPARPNAGAYDEMFSPDGTVRPPYRALHEAIAPTAAADLKVRSEALDPCLRRPGHHLLAVGSFRAGDGVIAAGVAARLWDRRGRRRTAVWQTAGRRSRGRGPCGDHHPAADRGVAATYRRGTWSTH